MDDSLKGKLRDLIAQHGPGLIQDAPKCAALVREACQNKKPEAVVLILAIDHGLPACFREAPNGALDPGLLKRLSQELQDNCALIEPAARWAVTTWAHALGMTDQTTAPVSAPAAFNIDPPACFYLGREYDLAQHTVVPDKFVMYDAKDLTTHGVIVGMTGSGKTGLAINILEEAAIDSYPCIMIDPKGDLTNLLLQFPDLEPAKFEKWLSPEEAQQKGLTLRQLAEQVADRWEKGLAETNQTPDRIGRLQASSEWRIYTPGSETGLPLSILGTFAPPKGALPREARTHKAEATATALLGLTGVSADPIQSREHILISHILLASWDAGRSLDLSKLILQIQDPPIRTIGAYNLETFFPAKERIKFASTLNNILAAPGFTTWTTGEPLDLANMLYRAGKPQQLIFYIAHLDDRQRMFFTTLLLEEVLAWMRRQSGSNNLRAVVYMDEVFGYLPPHPANPPSKIPLLTLLKQGRAFGVGVLLATQNPVDLDYKALSNAGTWFVGKLQTERDKLRLLDGLTSVAAEQGVLHNRPDLETVISSLGNRIFLMHDIHKGKPLLFQSRWALSFLRGPLTHDEVAELMKPYKQPSEAVGIMAIPLCTHCHAELGPDVTDTCPSCGKRPWANAQFRRQEQAFRDGLKASAAASSLRPVLPADVTQFYLEAHGPDRGEVEYQPCVLGVAEVAFVIDKRKGVQHNQTFRLLAKPAEVGRPVDWHNADPAPERLVADPVAQARWTGVPTSLDTGRKLKALEKAFANWLFGAKKLPLFENRALGLVSIPGEELEAFRIRCRAAAEQQAQQALDMEKVKFEPKFKALGLSLPQHDVQKQTVATSRPAASTTPIPNAPLGPPASRQDKEERKLKAEYESKENEICKKWKQVGEGYTAVAVQPRKADVRVTHFGLAWAPYWLAGGAPAYR
jgi:hypothetical protein